MPENSTEPSAACPNKSLACDFCGHFGAVEFGARHICPDCYGQHCSSCCPEFGQEEKR